MKTKKWMISMIILLEKILDEVPQEAQDSDLHKALLEDQDFSLDVVLYLHLLTLVHHPIFQIDLQNVLLVMTDLEKIDPETIVIILLLPLEIEIETETEIEIEIEIEIAIETEIVIETENENLKIEKNQPEARVKIVYQVLTQKDVHQLHHLINLLLKNPHPENEIVAVVNETKNPAVVPEAVAAVAVAPKNEAAQAPHPPAKTTENESAINPTHSPLFPNTNLTV